MHARKKGQCKGGPRETTDVCTDYQHNLYAKFKSERPTDTTSLASKSKNIRLVRFADRLVCLCLKHHNFGLKLRALKKALPPTHTITVIPDNFVEQYFSENCLEMLETLASSLTIAFQELRRKEVEPRYKKIRCSAIFLVFVRHKSIVKNQYDQVFELKSNLKRESCTI